MPAARRTARQNDLLQRMVALMAAEGFASFTLDDLAEQLHSTNWREASRSWSVRR
jgi:AcrR family transcriptional regulator